MSVLNRFLVCFHCGTGFLFESVLSLTTQEAKHIGTTQCSLRLKKLILSLYFSSASEILAGLPLEVLATFLRNQQGR